MMPFSCRYTKHCVSRPDCNTTTKDWFSRFDSHGHALTHCVLTPNTDSLILGIVDDILSKTEVRVLSETIQMQLVRPEEFRRRATRRGAASGEPQFLLQKELDQAVERESQARTVASALAVVSLVSVVVAIASSRRS